MFAADTARTASEGCGEYRLPGRLMGILLWWVTKEQERPLLAFGTFPLRRGREVIAVARIADSPQVV